MRRTAVFSTALAAAFLVMSVLATPARASTTVVSLAGDEDEFGYGVGSSVPCVFYDLHEADDPGAMDSELVGSETETWRDDFTGDPSFQASGTIEKVVVEVREIFSDPGGSDSISFDGSTPRPFDINGQSLCDPPVVQTFEYIGEAAAFAADGIVDVVFSEFGDDIAIDWSRVTVTYSSSVEVCDGADNDGDGEIDEGLTATFYADDDSDSFGDADAATDACSAPSGHVSDATDCDDTNAAVNPNAAEADNGIDDDCDTQVDEGFDLDLDGYTPIAGGDTDDADATVYPGAPELCDGKDNDQNTTVDDGFPDADSDGQANCVDADDDGDGIDDAQDPDVVAEAVVALPGTSWASGGQRSATLDRLNKAESLIAAGDYAGARIELAALRKRVDGCNGGSQQKADKNDWIVDCEDQLEVRALIDALLAALQ